MIIKKIQKLADSDAGFAYYKIGVEMESGEKYIAYAKNAVPPYQPGDDVQVTLTGKTDKDTGHQGASINKPQGNQGGSGYPNHTQDNPQHPQNGSGVYGATVGMAIKESVNMLIATGKQDEANWPEYVETRAKAIIALALRLEAGKPPLADPRDAEHGKPETGPQEIDPDEDVPF